MGLAFRKAIPKSENEENFHFDGIYNIHFGASPASVWGYAEHYIEYYDIDYPEGYRTGGDKYETIKWATPTPIKDTVSVRYLIKASD